MEIVTCHNSGELEGSFQRLERALRAGHWLAGLITYEAELAPEEILANSVRGLVRAEVEFGPKG